MRIDIHAHCFPEAYVEALDRRGVPEGDAVRGLGAGDSDGEIEARLALMDEAGVDVQALSLSSLGAGLSSATDAVAVAQIANDRYAALVARHPRRFVAFAAVPLPHVDEAIGELDRALALPGFVGVGVTTAVLGRSIADPAFDPFFAELDRRAAVVFVHPAGRGVESPLVVDNRLTWLVGAPIEDTVAVVHLIARGLPTRFPRVRFVICHLGGALPVLLGRLEHQFPRLVPDAPEPPTRAARRLWFDTVGHGDPQALAAAVAAFGPDRLVLGSDFPYVRGPDYRGSVAYVRDGLGGDADALGRTAARLLGLSA